MRQEPECRGDKYTDPAVRGGSTDRLFRYLRLERDLKVLKFVISESHSLARANTDL